MYAEGHLPGAAFVDLERDLAAPPGERGRHPLPDVAVFEAAMRRCGVRDGHPVVVYDAADATSAARCWWLLRYHGHADVRVLDGGLRAWVAAGQPLTTGVPDVVPGDFTARPGALPVLDADAAADVARDGTLVDARAPERYRGEVEPIDPVAGHIPGAVNVPTATVVDVDGRFLDPEVLRANAFRDVRGPVGVYCGSGVTACQVVLALDLAGIDASLYAGSWSEWIRNPRSTQ